jgi:phosphate transport system permease protein
LIFVIQFGYGFSILSGALALTLFNLPLLTRNIEESLRAIHYTQREAGLALGLSRWETVTKIVVPDALPGILTGIILSSGRIFGEAALDFTNLNPLSVSSPLSIFRQAETLAVHIWKINTEGTMPDGNAVSAGASAVLILAVLLFNFGARAIGKRLHRKMTST